MLSQFKFFHIAISLCLLLLSFGCGQADKSGDAITTALPVNVLFTMQATAEGMMHVGQGTEVVSSPISYDKIESYQLALDDGRGNQAVFASSNMRRGSQILLQHVSDPSKYPVRITEVGNQQLKVEVNLHIASDGRNASLPFRMILLIKQKSDAE